jgi:hypothetical protein
MEYASRPNLPVTDMYLGLHVGEVFYGNVGSAERFDFTVVGPAVNKTSRIAAICRSVEHPGLPAYRCRPPGIAGKIQASLSGSSRPVKAGLLQIENS